MRMQTYETSARAAGRAADEALALYAWNARIGGALLTPLHMCEVVIRNAVADALEAVHGSRWPWNPGFERSLPRPLGPGYNAVADLQTTRARAKSTGDVIANLKFVFWEKTFTSRHDTKIWDPYLRQVLPNLDERASLSTHRKQIFDNLNQVRLLRNRIAHHEPIFMRNLLDDFQTIQRLVEARCRTSSEWMLAQQQVLELLAMKPF
ncbi:hypothetical protein RAM80_18810 [Pseudomonas sp. App30]|uniref:hypothetical protein n=1 Tax=Pseudomonas sp. App30 TaxID=3068990 RepID=UPI003A80A5F8